MFHKFNSLIPKSALYAVIGIVTVFAMFAGAFAFTVDPGSVPNPGHALSEFQGFFQGDPNLEVSLGKLQQRVSDVCADNSLVRQVNEDGSVICESNVQVRVSITCPAGSAMTAIAPNGTPTCTVDQVSGLDVTNCTIGKFINKLNADSSVSCSAGPLKCVWTTMGTRREYTPGAECNPTSNCFNPPSLKQNKKCTCGSNGSWSCVVVSNTQSCPNLC